MAFNLPHDNKEFLNLIAKGDTAAYQILFSKYWEKIYVNALAFTKVPELAKDLAQEVFIRIWIKKERLADVENFEAYLYRVAKNIFYDHLHKKVLIETNDPFLTIYFEDKGINSLQNLELKELNQEIENAIGALPLQVKTAFELSRKQGLTHEQIAKKMNISKLTSKSYISRGILSIKLHLEARGFLKVAIFGFFLLFSRPD